MFPVLPPEATVKEAASNLPPLAEDKRHEAGEQAEEPAAEAAERGQEAAERAEEAAAGGEGRQHQDPASAGDVPEAAR